MFFPEVDPQVVERVLEEARLVSPEVAISLMESLLRWDMVAALRKSSVPRFCIASAWLNKAMRERWSPYFPIVKMEGVGHFPMLEDRVGFQRLLREVLENLTEILKVVFPGGSKVVPSSSKFEKLK